MRHWSLILMLNCPSRSPVSFSNLLAGGILKSFKVLEFKRLYHAAFNVKRYNVQWDFGRWSGTQDRRPMRFLRFNCQRAARVYGICDTGSNGLGYRLFMPLNGLPYLIKFSRICRVLLKRPPTPRRGYPGATTRSDKKHFSEKMAIGDGELSSTVFLWHNVNDSEDIESYKCIR